VTKNRLWSFENSLEKLLVDSMRIWYTVTVCLYSGRKTGHRSDDRWNKEQKNREPRI